MKLELVPMPVTDIDRARTFYVDMVGFHEDVDVQPAPGMRIVQLTPAGSACSILLSSGLPDLLGMAPGSIKGRAMHPAATGSSSAEYRRPACVESPR